MELEELRALNNEIITDEQFDQIEEMEYVTIENNGSSGLHIGRNWYTVYYEDDYIKEEFNVFL